MRDCAQGCGLVCVASIRVSSYFCNAVRPRCDLSARPAVDGFVRTLR